MVISVELVTIDFCTLLVIISMLNLSIVLYEPDNDSNVSKAS